MRLLARLALASLLSNGCVRPLMLADGADGSGRGDLCAVNDPCWQGGSGGDVGDAVSVAVAGTILVAITVELIRRL